LGRNTIISLLKKDSKEKKRKISLPPLIENKKNKNIKPPRYYKSLTLPVLVGNSA